MTRRCKHYSSLAEVVSPARDRLRAVLFVSQTIQILGFEQLILGIFVVLDIVLFVVDHEIPNALGDRVRRVSNPHPEGPERGVTDVSSALHFAIRLRSQRDMA